jgi:hypothetical protein
MDAFSFFLRTLALTIIAVLVMQVRWGTSTIEDQVMNFMTSSAIVRPIDDTAKGAVVLIRNSWTKITQTINTNFTNALRKENQPGSRLGSFSFGRSEEYVKSKTQEVRDAGENAAQDVAMDTESFVKRFKKKAAEVGRKAKKSFIDETEVPSFESVREKARTKDSSLARSIGAEDEAEQDESSAEY